MRSFQQLVLALFALLACAFAMEEEEIAYDATVYITSTVYRVNTVTASSSAAGYAPVNQTSTISAVHPTMVPTYVTSNGTSSVMPTASAPIVVAPSASQPAEFEGAASSINVNTFVVAVAAGLGYLVL
ncbi:hypothetical protein DDE82_008192 [Stemphylium lycopersici]|uniref:Uncharacterized protein n=1 Tax=Stemphylium lycopersici TaxID=183478 RepID=A0A364N5D8_STELY|nr:hypothetical protein DDE82_008192 [Stemphylium lycopersici]RAR12534.1 hypothetical protein DDE83_004066 [Stemphylium lycopersici]